MSIFFQFSGFFGVAALACLFTRTASAQVWIPVGVWSFGFELCTWLYQFAVNALFMCGGSKPINVHLSMGYWIGKFQVAQIVILLVPIFMMNYFMRLQWTPKMLLHYVSVFYKFFSVNMYSTVAVIVYPAAFICKMVCSSFVHSSADARTKFSLPWVKWGRADDAMRYSFCSHVCSLLVGMNLRSGLVQCATTVQGRFYFITPYLGEKSWIS